MGHDWKRHDRLGMLISTIARMGRTRFDIRVKELGLTRPQWRALNCIRYHPGINQAGLATMLEVEQMTVTRQLDLLEAKGWIERRADPADRRARCLYLTENTAPLLEKLNVIVEQLHAETYSVVSESEQQQLEKLLQKIQNRMTELLGETDASYDFSDDLAQIKTMKKKA